MWLPSGREDRGLLGLELGIGEDALVAQRPELLELGELVVHAGARSGGGLSRCRRRGWRRCVGRTSSIFSGPPLLLVAVNSPSGGLGRAGDHRSAGDGPEDGTAASDHLVPLRLDYRSAVCVGVGVGVEGFDEVGERDAAAGHELAARTADGARERGGPDVLPDQQAGAAARVEELGD